MHHATSRNTKMYLYIIIDSSMKESGRRVFFRTEKSSTMGVVSARKNRQHIPPRVLENTRKAIDNPPVFTPR